MPHECTDCGRTFADGSKEMLSGCPDCGGNTFQFKPAGRDEEAAAATAEQPDPPDPPEPPVDSSVARTVGNAATAVRDFVGSGNDEPESGGAGVEPSKGTAMADSETTMANGKTGTTMADTEDEAQASARSDIVSPDDLPPSPEHPAVSSERDGGRSVSNPGTDRSATDDTRSRPAPVVDDTGEDDRPDLSQLREELNEQFESIRVLNPGQYELNLMELYNREEYIIALQEDGKYTIQVPERWEEK